MRHCRRPRKIPVLIAAAALLLVAVGCRGQTAGVSAEEGRRNAGRTVPCPPATANHDPKATFTWMYSVGNTSFDPDRITTNNSIMYLAPIYDSLVHLDSDLKPEPMLATSWKLVDDSTLELRLRHGWHFHDGAPFDASAVRANLLRHRDLKGSFNSDALKSVTGVEVRDPYTVRVIAKGAAAPLVNVLAGSAGMMMSPKVMNDPKQSTKPTGGSGAYRMTRYVPGDRVEYTATENYWEPEALQLHKLVMLISGDDNARLNAVSTGTADATFLRAQIVRPAREAGLVICQKPSLTSYNMNLNTSRGEFGDRRVRQAVNYAINRTAISQLLNGLCQPSVQLFPRTYFAADPKLTADYYRYDPARARELLAAAGLKDGFHFTLEVMSLDQYLQIAQVIQQNLVDVGIKMDIVPVQLAKLTENFSVTKSAEASLGEQKVELDPSIMTGQYYLKDGFNNPGGFTTPEITALHRKAMIGPGQKDRAPYYAKLMRAVAREAAPNVTLCNLSTPFAMNKKVNGLRIYADATRQFRGVSMTPGRG